jgi:hypothetical protein
MHQIARMVAIFSIARAKPGSAHGRPARSMNESMGIREPVLQRVDLADIE